MAKQVKQGAIFYSKDCDYYEDFGVQRVRNICGAVGMYALDYITCQIYRIDGYFLKWEDDMSEIIADNLRCGITKDDVDKLIDACIKYGIFDKDMFEANKVLTSKAIQENFIRMCSTREHIKIVKAYFLLDINDKAEVPAFIKKKLMFLGIDGKVISDECEKNEADGSEYLPLKNGEIAEITESEIEEYKGIYKDIDCKTEINKMKKWLEVNPEKQKSATEINKFVNNWLSRAQDNSAKYKKNEVDHSYFLDPDAYSDENSTTDEEFDRYIASLK